MENVNDTFFDGHYKDIWRASIPEELTAKEVDFMLQHFGLGGGSRVLDIMCGYGRHSLALARRGVAVTAVDNLKAYVDEVRGTAERENLPVEALQGDALRFKTERLFDLAICMGNSLNFFNASDTTQLLTRIGRQLKAGGALLINTWSLAEIVFKQLSRNSWAHVGELKMLSESRCLFHPTRIETETQIIQPDSLTEVKQAIDYIFSINEMEVMAASADLRIEEIYSIPGRKKFTLGEPRAYLVLQKL